MVELLALEIDFRAAEMPGEALGEIQRRRPADIVPEIARSFPPGMPDRPWHRRKLFQIEDQRHQRFRDKAARRKCRTGRVRRDRCGREFGLARLIVAFRHGRLVPAIPRLTCSEFQQTWMPGTSPGMTLLSRLAQSSTTCRLPRQHHDRWHARREERRGSSRDP